MYDEVTEQNNAFKILSKVFELQTRTEHTDVKTVVKNIFCKIFNQIIVSIDSVL